MSTHKPFQFEISLSVLNHLGRNLYRNFITVLGEAISNSWDANANNVWIYIDRDNSNFVIKDDGDGMNTDDFQNKFLRVGYSKRKDGGMKSSSGRPYIGAKGIGKLALLSCADVISIISKTSDTEYVGGVINNAELDEAITEELKPEEYPLRDVDMSLFDAYIQDHTKGTIIHFEQTKESIRNTVPYLKKLIALNFRFSLIDDKFNIFVNDDLVTLDDLKDLANATEFLWNINDLEDPYLDEHLSELKESGVLNFPGTTATGFIASVAKPSSLKINGVEEKAGIDLFVNGRLRERNILKHLPDFSTRHVASYLYGQIHLDELDDDITAQSFTSSREGITADNSKYTELLEILKEKILNHVSDEWDEWRLKHKKDGDPENTRMTKKERSAKTLAEEAFAEFTPSRGSETRDRVEGWIDELSADARFNLSSYVDCFISENLLRKHITDTAIDFTIVADSRNVNMDDVVQRFRTQEVANKATGGINISLRRNNDDLSYLDMACLTKIVEPHGGAANTMPNNANEYKPIRDALMHTAVLTSEAKRKLTSVYDNIKGRLNILLASDDSENT